MVGGPGWVCCGPACHEQENDQPFRGKALSCHLCHLPHPKCSRVFRQSVPPARCLISSSFQRYPVCSRLHVLNRTSGRPSRLQAEVIVIAHIDHQPLRIPAAPVYFSALFISQALAITPLMFQCWDTSTILLTWHRTDGASSAASRGLGAACCSWGTGGLCPEDPAMTWNSVWLHESWRKKSQEMLPNPPCDLPYPACSHDPAPWG